MESILLIKGSVFHPTAPVKTKIGISLSNLHFSNFSYDAKINSIFFLGSIVHTLKKYFLLVGMPYFPLTIFIVSED